MQYLTTSLLFCLLHIVSFSQTKDSTQDFMLWQISGNNMPSPSYLYGTIHTICAGDVNISPLAKQKLANCKQLYLEVAPMIKNDTAIKNISLQKTTLEKLVGKKYYARLKELFQNHHISDSALNTIPPYWATSLLGDFSIGCAVTSIENELIKLAKPDSIAMFGLESLTEHEVPVNTIPTWQQVENLKRTIDNFDHQSLHTLEVISLYLEGNLEKIYQKACCNQYGEKTEHAIDFLDKRNQLWIPKMEKAFMQQPCFFAFGCAHLVSDMGIINLLLKKGYTITPMFYVEK
jgi:uncharacterized protein YbaP (TraB family)